MGIDQAAEAAAAALAEKTDKKKKGNKMVRLVNRKDVEKADSSIIESAVSIVKFLARIDYKKESNALADIVNDNKLDDYLALSQSYEQIEELMERLEKDGYKRNSVYKHLVNLLEACSK